MPQLHKQLRKGNKRVYSPRFHSLMNVLVIGDEHTYGYGLSAGKLSYIGHFIRQISQTGQAVSVEAYAHLTMTQLLSTLAQLPLNRYDLIMLQLDHTLMQLTQSTLLNSLCVSVPILPHEVSNRTLQTKGRRVGAIGTGLLSFVRPMPSLSISALLKKLRPYRHNVLLLTPFPQREWISQWLHQRSRTVVLNEAGDQLFSVFDVDSVIRPREEYFLADDKEHLNDISHEVLGRSLFDFYQSAPTIVTVQAIKRE